MPTKICGNLEAWLNAHAFFITALCGAIYLAGGDCKKLSGDGAVLTLMTQGVREGFAAVRALGQIAMPFSLKVLFIWMHDAVGDGRSLLERSGVEAPSLLRLYHAIIVDRTRPLIITQVAYCA